MELIQYENERMYTEAHIQYCELRGTYDAVIKENAALKAALKKEIMKSNLKAGADYLPLTSKNSYF